MSPATATLSEPVTEVARFSTAGGTSAGWVTPLELAIGRQRPRPVRPQVSEMGQEALVDVPEQSIGVPDARPRPRIIERAAEARFRALHQFEGTVLEILDGEFVARTRDLSSPDYADEHVTLPLDDVSPSDMELLRVGAVFYWLIGYKENDEGARERTSLLRFRRLPAWSTRAITRVYDAASELIREFADQGSIDASH